MRARRAHLLALGPAVERLLLWAALVLFLQGVLTVVQIPLYASFVDSDRLRHAALWVHRVRADVAVSAMLYLVLALGLRDFEWVTRTARAPLAVLTAGGVVFALAREWLFVAASPVWPYHPWMPTLAGVGLAPIFAAVVTPLAAAFVLRRFL